MKIYRSTDEIKLTYGDVTVTVSPLPFDKKMAMGEAVSISSGTETHNAGKAAAIGLKYGLKKIEGLEYADGEPYELKFDANGGVTDECLGELFAMQELDMLLLASTHVSGTLKDPKFEDIKVEFPGTKTAKKK